MRDRAYTVISINSQNAFAICLSNIKYKKIKFYQYSSILNFKNRVIGIMSSITITMFGKSLKRQGRIVSVEKLILEESTFDIYFLKKHRGKCQ
jgi:hypothetical protein